MHSGTTGTHDWVRLFYSNTAVNAYIRAWFDLTNDCAVGTSDAVGVATLDSTGTEILGNGWYRIWMTGDIGANTDARIYTQNQTADGNATEETTNSVWWWGTELYEHDNVVSEATGYDIPAATLDNPRIEKLRLICVFRVRIIRQFGT